MFQLDILSLSPFPASFNTAKSIEEMSQFKIYFVRHAETVANRNKVLQGHVDYPLTDEGQEMAFQLGELLGTKPFHCAYSSDLGRAHTTFRLASSRFPTPLDADLQLSELLREVGYGIFEGLPRSLKLNEVKAIRASERGVEVHEVEDDRESLGHVIERQRKFLRLVQEGIEGMDTDEPVNVLCVSHGGYIKRFLEQHCKVKLRKMLDNCSTSVVTVIKDTDGTLHLHARPDEINIPPTVSYIP